MKRLRRTTCWRTRWTAWRCGTGFSYYHSGPISWSQRNPHFFQSVSHAIVEGQPPTLRTDSPQLFQLYIIGSCSVYVSTLLCCRHSVFTSCDLHGIFLACLIKLNVSDGSVLFLDITCIISDNFNRANFGSSLLINGIILHQQRITDWSWWASRMLVYLFRATV